ncbi:sigma-70 family RNA polymerase sigma factor [Undibacterium sp. Ji50W]|uniref:sigma-70 family RNA polymerase sigma factor n=1 Tax=Undibacterium sp. Ji50W TaxID=3413041 RepID=UPI003BF23F3C
MTDRVFSASAQASDNGAEAVLWQRWRDNADIQAREDLVAIYYPYAKTLAASLYAKRFSHDIDFEEYQQLALVGMLDAMDRYDPQLGMQFNTFAGSRIRGTVLDGIEVFSERQQQITVHQRLKLQRLQASKKMAETPNDTATDSDDVFRRLADVGLGLALSWLLENSGMVAEMQERITEPTQYQRVELKQLQKQIQARVDQLSQQEKKVIRYHYLQNIPFEEIADILKLSKGRIAQIHQSALRNLKQKLLARRDFELVC